MASAFPEDSQMDDVFDEETGEDMVRTRDFERMKESRVKQGFRDGMSDGRLTSLQEGFNRGYSEGVGQTLQLARLRGLLCGLLTYHMAKEGTTFTFSEQVVSAIKQLIMDLSSVENTGLDSQSHGASATNLSMADDLALEMEMMQLQTNQSGGSPGVTELSPEQEQRRRQEIVFLSFQRRCAEILRAIGWEDGLIEQILTLQIPQ
ncbi:protein YAE1 homolog [Branchiostoma lanceolatum]|uniref:protein YAE1 homolog n=1 Tax=Branchiostoma lanceolatum TaxID=7740 RepID=UPI00345676E5